MRPGAPCARRFLDRPYGRVDRPKLKQKLLERCVSAGVSGWQRPTRAQGCTLLHQRLAAAGAGQGCAGSWLAVLVAVVCLATQRASSLAAIQGAGPRTASCR
jgi:hypothetical protein